MKHARWLAVAVSAALFGSAQAQEVPVTGVGASGLAGSKVFVRLLYDFGSGFGVVAEDLQFAYQSPGIAFDRAASTVERGAASEPFAAYVDELTQYAQTHAGSFLENLTPGGLPAGYAAGYALSFEVAGDPQTRVGMVRLNLAFDIAPDARPGSMFDVSFSGTNDIATASDEYVYPSAVQHLPVQVVPEPGIVWMLAAGLAMLGICRSRGVG